MCLITSERAADSGGLVPRDVNTRPKTVERRLVSVRIETGPTAARKDGEITFPNGQWTTDVVAQVDYGLAPPGVWAPVVIVLPAFCRVPFSI